MTDIQGRAVLVTGANRGMGREFVNQFLAAGARTVYAAARDPRSVVVTDDRVVPLALDVTDPEAVAAAARTAVDVDILVNNAGISTGTPVLAADTSALRKELEVNLFGAVSVTLAFAASLVQRGGAVVNVASALAWIALGGNYSVSKAALWSATESIRLQLGPQGVQVLGLYMGYVDTDMTQGVTDPKSTPEEIVAQVLDGLLSGASEVLADRTARDVRAGLSLPVEDRYAAFVATA